MNDKQNDTYKKADKKGKKGESGRDGDRSMDGVLGHIGRGDPVKAVGEKSNIPFSEGALRVFTAKYTYGPKGLDALTRYLGDIVTKKSKSGPRLFFDGGKSHPHPVGATLRYLYDDYIHYGYEPKRRILDVGSSLVRLASAKDFDGNPLCARIHSMAPILSGRDMLRDINNRGKIDFGFFNTCRHVAGQRQERCEVCDGDFDVVKSVDSIYYPGVLEEIARHGSKGGIGYVAFNDYHAAQILNGNEGSCLDGESTYRIQGDKVTSTVKGNVAPYIHRYLQTGGRSSWQYMMQVDGKLYWCVFEVLMEFWNGDVPYRLCRVNTLSHAELALRNELTGVDGVKAYSNVWCPDSGMYHKDMDEGNTGVVLNTTKITSVNLSPPQLSPNLSKILSQPSSGEKLQEVGLRMSELEHRRVVKAGDKTLDFRHREGNSYHGWDLLDFTISQFNSHNERIFTTYESDHKHYVTVELTEKCWYLLGLRGTTKIYKASLEMVRKAFTRLSTKAQTTSIDFALAQAQREMEAELGSDIYDLSEAFIIARIIRAQQTCRLKEALDASNSVRVAIEGNKK